MTRVRLTSKDMDAFEYVINFATRKKMYEQLLEFLSIVGDFNDDAFVERYYSTWLSKRR